MRSSSILELLGDFQLHVYRGRESSCERVSDLAAFEQSGL